ncbi:MAG: aminoacyl-tRNA hydrolase [Planctomycetota bacterium]
MARLVVGLGNPGAEYDGTRHNVGFAVLDHLAETRGSLFRGPSRLDGWTGPRGFEWARCSADGGEAFLLKPGTFMNRSGDIVAPVARWLVQRGELPALVHALDPGDEAIGGDRDRPAQPSPDSILVVYDDMDLDVGRLRLRPHGGHGGQNGMRSIIHRLATDRFFRLRVGIGRAGTDAARHVLSAFSGPEGQEIEVSIAEATEAIEAWLDGEAFADVMTRFHSRWNQRDL